MNKQLIVLGSIALCSHSISAQETKEQDTVDQSDIELVYNHYIQDGNHSAVTGGTGTEALTVYGPSVNIKRGRKNNILTFNVGTDIISSASTDNIDYVKSSASYTDIHGYTYGVLEHRFRNGFNLYGGMGFSIESDYFSYSGRLGFSKEDVKKQRSYFAEIQAFNDDLRWGRINENYYKAVKLIYPEELRYREWYDGYKRYSYNFKAGFTQIVDKRNVIGFYPELIWQQGLLSTPFHRVYFTNGQLMVEQLPEQRLKASLGLKWNRFAGGRTVLKQSINAYTDNFGIRALALEQETAIKLNRVLTILPNVRFYTQSAADYFKPYKQHDISEQYYTSDYDYSRFYSYSIGMGFRYNPFKTLNKHFLFKGMTLRYNYYQRSDGLWSHILSASFQSVFTRNTKK
ncbi:hypothetical protein D3C71_441980 [compost metagenome]